MVIQRFFIFLLTLFWSFHISAQQIAPKVVSSAGGVIQNDSIQINWTLGEVVIAYLTTPQFQISQGFHQPNFIISSIRELPEDLGQILVYPNPTTNWIEMKLDFEQKRQVDLQLFNNNGQLIWQRKIEGQNLSERSSMADLPAGSYLLRFLIDKQAFTKILKIQKLN